MPNPYAYASFHVEHVDKEYATGAEPEAEFQEPEGQYEVADPEQELEANFTDYICYICSVKFLQVH